MMELQWPLILFTTLVAWSAGLFGTQALMAVFGVGKKAQVPAWVCSAVLLAAGGIAVFFHLEHWERIFNGFGHLTSGITQELIAIVVLAVVAVAYLVLMRKSDDGASVPKWLAWVAVALSVVLVAVMAHDALGADHVHGVMLPGPYSSESSIDDAEALAANLGISNITVPICEPFEAFEAVLARGDRRLGRVLERVWRSGGRLDAWSEHLSVQRWLDAFAACGLDPAFYANRRRSEDEILPWSMISCGVAPGYLKREHALSYEGVTTPDCRTHCNACGANCLVGGKCDV